MPLCRRPCSHVRSVLKVFWMVLVSSFPCTSSSTLVHVGSVCMLPFLHPHSFCSEHLAFVCLSYWCYFLLMLQRSPVFPAMPEALSVPELAQLPFLKLGALLAASFSSQSSHTRSQGTECSTLTC